MKIMLDLTDEEVEKMDELLSSSDKGPIHEGWQYDLAKEVLNKFYAAVQLAEQEESK